MYDLLIRNARIIDGTGCPCFNGELALNGRKIAAVGHHLLDGAVQVLDIRNHVVAPGFIDAHSHSDMLIEEFPECIGAAEQGITTQVAGMCGQSAAPLSPKHLEDGLRYLASLKDGPLPSPAENRFSFGAYLRKIDRPLGTNMAFLVGHGTIRAAVMGYSDRKPDRAEMKQMQKRLAGAMDGGALGISFGLIYPPGSYCGIDEMAELCQVAAEWGGLMTVHLRSEGAYLEEALEEMLEVTRRSGVRCVISHHKATGGPANWGKTVRTLEIIERANAEGLDVFCDQYPYTASSTALATNIPDKFYQMGVSALLDMLASDEGRQKLRPLILKDKTPEERFQYTMIGRSRSHPEYNGRMLNDIAKDLGEDAYRLQCDILREDELTTVGIFHTMSEDDLCRVLRCKRGMIGTDGFWYPGCTGCHPRSIGTFPRVLGRYVRDRHIIPLEEAVRKMTSLPAMVYGLSSKGLIRPGFDADLVVFDPGTIEDKADYTDWRARCTGMDYVLVGGRVTAENAVFTGARNGQILYRA